MTRYCPLCGAEDPEIVVLGICREPVGCDRCLTLQPGDEFFEERDRETEHFMRRK